MGALTGLKILDFSTLLPGPMGTMMLADLGADVISVTGPGKPDLMNGFPPIIDELGSSASSAWLGRNKRSIELNLKKPEAVEAVKKMIMDYDIVIEQFRPGVMAKLGLGYEDLKAVNPGIIYCSISGFGQNGPLVQKADHDLNYMALSGNLVFMDGKEPQTVNIPNFHLADITGGGYVAPIAILAAVYHRMQTGEGQYIDLGMLDGIMAFNCIEGLGVLAARKYPEAKGWHNRHISGLAIGPNVAPYQTKDGKYMMVSSMEPKFLANLCETLGFPEWANGKAFYKEPETVRAALTEKFKEKTRDEWTEIFMNVDACVEPILDIVEAWDSEQLKAREMSVEVPLSIAADKTIEQIANPIKFSATPVEYKHTGYPVGYNTQEVLSELGFSDEVIADISAQ